MSIGINIDITLRDNVTGKYLRIPVIPEVITWVGGDALVTSVNILQLGTVEFPAGKDLDGVSFASFFPGRYDPSYCKYSGVIPPMDFINIIEGWKTAHTTLQLIIPAIALNKTMYVRSFPWEYKGFEGDIHYTLDVREVKVVRPVQISTAAATLARANSKTPAARPAVVAAKKVTKYTVKSGDNLTSIAKKLGIANWRTGIYDKNKKVIGSNPNKIKPGQVLTV